METAVGINLASDDDTSVKEHDRNTDTILIQLFECYISYFLIVSPC